MPTNFYISTNTPQLIPTNHSRHQSKGFSLPELITIIALLAIIITASAIPISAFMQKRRIQSLQNNLINALETTQSRSINIYQNSKHGLKLNSDSFNELSQAQDTDPIHESQPQTFPQGVSLTTPTNTLFFSKRTGIPEFPTPLEIKLETAKFHTTIAINSTGALNIFPINPK